jgi:hypothetical protein
VSNWINQKHVAAHAFFMDLTIYGCSLFVEHHGVIFNILWEMVVSSDTTLKINATALLKALVSFPVHE